MERSPPSLHRLALAEASHSKAAPQDAAARMAMCNTVRLKVQCILFVTLSLKRVLQHIGGLTYLDGICGCSVGVAVGALRRKLSRQRNVLLHSTSV